MATSGPNEESPPREHANTFSPQGPRGGPALATAASSPFRWAIKSLRGSKLGSPGNVAYVGKSPTWEPLEAKSGPLEVMTLPTSLRQDNPENYSGEGRDQDGEEANTPSAARSVSGEEKVIEGSSEGSNFPGGLRDSLSSSKVKFSSETEPSLSNGQNELKAVLEHTTLSQWQLEGQPTTLSPHGSQEPETAEEARGEILYVHRPSDNLSSAFSSRGETSSNGGFTPVFRKHSKGLGRNSSHGEAKAVTASPEALMEVLTTSVVTTAGFLATRDMQRTDPSTTTTTNENSSDSSSTEETSFSALNIQGATEKSAPLVQAHLSATSAPSEGSQTTTGVVQLATVASDFKVAATQMESRSAVSESFILGSRWTPFKGSSPRSDNHKDPVMTDSKATNNPFGILVPNWAFGMIPSGTSTPVCS